MFSKNTFIAAWVIIRGKRPFLDNLTYTDLKVAILYGSLPAMLVQQAGFGLGLTQTT
jgi:hypothetical protein